MNLNWECWLKSYDHSPWPTYLFLYGWMALAVIVSMCACSQYAYMFASRKNNDHNHNKLGNHNPDGSAINLNWECWLKSYNHSPWPTYLFLYGWMALAVIVGMCACTQYVCMFASWMIIQTGWLKSMITAYLPVPVWMDGAGCHCWYVCISCITEKQ